MTFLHVPHRPGQKVPASKNFAGIARTFSSADDVHSPGNPRSRTNLRDSKNTAQIAEDFENPPGSSRQSAVFRKLRIVHPDNRIHIPGPRRTRPPHGSRAGIACNLSTPYTFYVRHDSP